MDILGNIEKGDGVFRDYHYTCVDCGIIAPCNSKNKKRCWDCTQEKRRLYMQNKRIKKQTI